MSNADIDYIQTELSQTTITYSKWKGQGFTAGHWKNAVDRLNQLRTTTPPVPTPTPVPDTAKHFTGGSLSAWLGNLRAGDNGVLDVPGTLTQPITNGGNATARITVDCNGQIIDGRLDMRGTANFWTFSHTGWRDLAPLSPGHEQSWCIGGSDNIFEDFDSINGHTKIGWEFINDSTYGSAHRNLLRRYRIHQIGRLPFGSTNNDHGIYDIGFEQHYVDGLIYDCSDRALQLRGAKTAHAEYITWTGCGMGVIFGDLTATNNVVEKFIGTDNKVTSRFLIEEWDPNGVDRTNVVRDGLTFNRDGRTTIGGTKSVTFSNMVRVDPQLDADLMPQAAAAQGLGCRVVPPRILS